MSPSRVALLPDDHGARPRLDLSSGAGNRRGLLRPRLLRMTPTSARVALVADGALLLRGDSVRVEVAVGAGVRLVLVEPSGTVAYDMRGGSASWEVDARIAPGGTLVWHGQPFVVAEGADVARRTDVELGDGASLIQRETLVMGRSGEGCGRLLNQIRITRENRPVLVEDLRLGPEEPTIGVLGDHRVVDTVLALGHHPGPAVPAPDAPGVERYELAGGGTMWRALAGAAHQASLLSTWRVLNAA